MTARITTNSVLNLNDQDGLHAISIFQRCDSPTIHLQLHAGNAILIDINLARDIANHLLKLADNYKPLT